MIKVNRKEFIFSCSIGLCQVYPGWLVAARVSQHVSSGYIMSVRGKVRQKDIGVMLPHEHIITDFSGAEKIDRPQYAQAEAVKKMLPYLLKLKQNGVSTIAECTPAYIGRNVKLLQQLSKASGLNILTNTGYYAAADEKYLPAHAYTETAEQLAARWIEEWEHGIDGTDIKPGFIKLGVDDAPLKPVAQKLVHAAVITHLKTGLKIAIHTGTAAAAIAYVNIISAKVKPEAVIWVHAQNDNTGKHHIELAKKGCYISLDGVNLNAADQYCHFVKNLKEASLLHKILLSHDDGFAVNKQADKIIFDAYSNGNIHSYQSVFNVLKPALIRQGITSAEFSKITTINTGQAFKIETCPVV